MERTDAHTMKRLWGFAAPCKALILSSTLLATLGAACGVLPYLAVTRIVVLICAGQYALRPIAHMALLALAGYLAQLLLATAATTRSHRAAFTVLKNIRRALCAKLARVPMGFVLERPSGQFKTLLVDTVEKLELPLAHMIPELTANLLIPALLLIYFFTLDWRLALAAFSTFPLGLVCYMGMMKDYERRYRRVIKAGKAMDAATVEYIGGIEVVKVFNQSGRSYRKYSEAVRENEASKAEWFRKTNPYYAAGLAIAPSSLLVVLPLGCYLFMDGRLEAARFIACIVLALGLIAPLIQALRYTDSLAMVEATVREIGELLEAQEMCRPERALPLEGSEVEFSHVSFAYKETEVLHDVSFRAVPGGMTALVGPSGSGKSTVARLIASFWEADAGTVSLGGRDVRDLPLEEVMRQVAYVSQDNYLFHLSMRENIRLGRPEADDAAVEAAARQACCHDFITALPRGYDSLAGEGGSRLSGGERQRVAIARAILKDSPVIVLDEATAFTDPENEALIQRSLGALVEGKTLIVIAHRLSTITSADKILVLERGRVLAEGRHEALLADCPLYRGLWRAHCEARDTKEEARHDWTV